MAFILQLLQVITKQYLIMPLHNEYCLDSWPNLRNLFLRDELYLVSAVPYADYIDCRR